MKNGRNGSQAHHVSEARLAHEEILAFERKVNSLLHEVYQREAFEPAVRSTLEDVFESEESPKCPHCKNSIEMPAPLEQWGIRQETIKSLADLCCWDGVAPWNVMRNFYAICSHMGLRPWCKLTLREKATILGDSHGSEHLRIQRIINFLRKENVASFKAPGQKQIESRGSYSECQQGNNNRRRQNRSRHRNLKRKEKKLKA